jgi:hypothetical protein
MRAIVTVFKSELSQRDFVRSQLQPLCKQVIEADDAIIFCPRDVKIVEFLSVLRFHKVAYGTHFDTAGALAIA